MSAGWNDSFTRLNAFCAVTERLGGRTQQDAPDGQISPRHPASKSRRR
jgi:hypothetical protein